MDRGKKAFGNYGEAAAQGYLAAKGYEILEKNYKSAGGEIDIIAQDGDYLVFVEVKYRRGTNFGRPIEAITRRKQRALADCAMSYLVGRGLWDAPCRFDIVEVFGRELLEINHVINAFEVNYAENY